MTSWPRDFGVETYNLKSHGLLVQQDGETFSQLKCDQSFSAVAGLWAAREIRAVFVNSVYRLTREPCPLTHDPMSHCQLPSRRRHRQFVLVVRVMSNINKTFEYRHYYVSLQYSRLLGAWWSGQRAVVSLGPCYTRNISCFQYSVFCLLSLDGKPNQQRVTSTSFRFSVVSHSWTVAVILVVVVRTLFTSA